MLTKNNIGWKMIKKRNGGEGIELSVNIADKVKRLMGWCPVADTKISKPASGEDYANIPEGGGDASPKLSESLFEWDYIGANLKYFDKVFENKDVIIYQLKK